MRHSQLTFGTYMNHLHSSHDPIDVDNDSSDIPMDVAVNISSRLFNENDQVVDLIVENMFAGVICYLLGGMPRAASYYTCLGCGERVTGTEFDPASLTELVDIFIYLSVDFPSSNLVS